MNLRLKPAATLRWGMLWTLSFWLIPLSAQLESNAEDGLTSGWRATYSVHYGKMVIGELQRELTVQSSAYRLSSRLTPTGMGRLFSADKIEQISTGEVADDGSWWPQQYVYINSAKADKPRDFLFDYGSVQIKFGGESLRFQSGIQDELSQLQTLARCVVAGEQEFVLSVFNGSKRRVYDHHFRVTGREKIIVRLNGKDEDKAALRVQLTTSRGKYLTQFWLAIDHGYLPLRIDRTRIDKGSTVTMELTRLDLL